TLCWHARKRADGPLDMFGSFFVFAAHSAEDVQPSLQPSPAGSQAERMESPSTPPHPGGSPTTGTSTSDEAGEDGLGPVGGPSGSSVVGPSGSRPRRRLSGLAGGSVRWTGRQRHPSGSGVVSSSSATGALPLTSASR